MLHVVRRTARRILAYWQILTRRERVTSEMDEEMRFHVEMQTERLMTEHGLPLQEARRRALVSFGGVEKYKEAGHDVHGLRWLDALLQDSRFSLRMLLKHRGLTMVGAFAMAVAIAVGATTFEAVSDLLDSPLPLPGGDRLVAVDFIGSNPGEPEQQVIHEFAALRGSLTTVEHFSGYKNAQHNLVAAETAPEPVLVAEITASAFAIANTPPLLGRYLLPSDEADAASPALVIGYQAWQLRFAGDADVVGRTVHLGGVPRTIVGVMPEGFEFPTVHQFWIPLREDLLKYAPGEGPSIATFGRLAPGVTIEQAQAEVAAVAQRTAVTRPDSDVPLRPLVLPYSQQVVEDPAVLWALRAAQWFAGALTVVVAINLAILVYARTVTRLGEIAVRSALGASRRRILAQLYIEALALALVGTAVGLGLTRYVLDVIQTLNETSGNLPYWVNFELSSGAVIFALGLAMMSALIMGVLPGLKATGTSVSTNLHELHGRSGTRLGATWTTLVVAQVAVAVAVLPAAVFIASRVVQIEMVGTGFAADSIVVAKAGPGPDAPPVDGDRAAAQQLELLTRLEAEPGVTGVAFSSRIPGTAFPRRIRFEDGVRVRAQAEHVADVGITDALFQSTNSVSIDMFDTYGVEILAGRTFAAADVGTTNVIVNRSFVGMYLDEPNAVGLSFRFDNKAANAAPVRWYQIVGVVRDFPAFAVSFTRDGEPTVYHPAGVGEISPLRLSVRFAGAVPPTFIHRFREIGAEVDPTLHLTEMGVLSDHYDTVRGTLRTVAWAAALVTTSVLLLSAAGIYALMSFTVAQRTREIGIRTALGAPPRRVLLNVFARAVWQVAAGVVVGSVLSAGAFTAIGLGALRALPLLLAVAGIMAFVAVLATFGPARRGVRIQAIEALRAEA
jgi:putative ABC transport system permease protein